MLSYMRLHLSCLDSVFRKRYAMDSFTFGVILSSLSALILATNSVVVVALILLIHKTESLGLCFVLNLAVADSIIGIAITGLATLELSKPITTPELHCALRMSFITSPSAASIMTMVLVAFDRYLAIKQPLRYLQLMTAPVVAMCLVALWVISCFYGFLPVIIEDFKTGTDPHPDPLQLQINSPCVCDRHECFLIKEDVNNMDTNYKNMLPTHCGIKRGFTPPCKKSLQQIL